MKEVEVTVAPDELIQLSWAGLLLTAVQVRVSVVPATTGLFCEALMLSECSSSEWLTERKEGAQLGETHTTVPRHRATEH
jgi:hypothetical protein